ncbi:serine protease inhibitor ecotin [Dysgonomonas sp. 25]|uniref:serine protease inhibitor ecotin n=1 Tax=Dysgonomonas sp. 25 TaxID=2302933 RepID=UPI0013D18BD9|nr:serine protease inhibitor ecotin [Dysgonomonas sp. 25]NDV69248.1 ecotin [Dysgonomonas sp. 25]
MKKITLIAIFALTGILFSANISAQTVKATDEAIKNLKPYPEKMGDMERHVIFLEPRADESLYKIEIIAGMYKEVDCNRHTLAGAFNEGTVEGWGYSYYTFETNGQIASTMMMCHDPKTTKFVSGKGEVVRYNSRLPLVVYLPQGVELKYRVWTAGEMLPE